MNKKFGTIPWKEEPTPENQKNCTKCGLFEHGSRMIWGEGNPDASMMIILDNPGERETKEGKSYVCGTRQTLQQAAFEVGLNESDFYITYILKRRPKRAYDKEQTRHICMQQHLQHQLQHKKPSLIFCLGNVAVQSFFGTNDIDVKTLRGKIHVVQGFHTVVAYHPLAIRRRPNLWQTFRDDWAYAAELFQQIK